MKKIFLLILYMVLILFNCTNSICYGGEIDDNLGDVTFGVDSTRIELDKEMKFSEELIKKEFTIKGKIKTVKNIKNTWILILDKTTYKYLDMNLKEFEGKKARIKLKSEEEIKLSNVREGQYVMIKGKLKENGMFYIDITECVLEELKN